MSKVKSPPEKKRLSYARDHYNRSLWNNKTWRKTKQIRKSDARRCFRKAANDSIRAFTVDEPDATAAPTKEKAIRQKQVEDFGSIQLRRFVETRRRTRDANGDFGHPLQGVRIGRG
jgi:hypothetical protein